MIIPHLRSLGYLDKCNHSLDLKLKGAYPSLLRELAPPLILCLQFFAMV